MVVIILYREFMHKNDLFMLKEEIVINSATFGSFVIIVNFLTGKDVKTKYS